MLTVVLALLSAHGQYPQSLAVSFEPTRPNDVAVSTTFGGVVSSDRGGHWSFICEEAVGYGANENPVWTMTPRGAYLVGGFSGLYAGRDGGCGWTEDLTFDVTGVSDLRVAGNVLIATSTKYGATNRVMRSTDDGLTWVPTGEQSNQRFYSAVRVAPSNPDLVYVSAWWLKPNDAEWLLVSTDRGQSFTTVTLTGTLPTHGVFTVLAVHPQDPLRLLASVSDDARAYLLLSTNGGASFTEIFSLTGLFNSATFAPNGVIYAAAGVELFASVDAGAFTARASPQRNACVALGNGTTFTCGWPDLDGYAVASLSSPAAAPESFLEFGQLKGPLQCPPGSSVYDICEPIWPVVQAVLPVRDAGTADAGSIDGGSTLPAAPRGCGCSAGGSMSLLALLLLRPRRLARPC